jgi:glutaredoxin-related protein
MSFAINHVSVDHSGELLGGCDIIMELLQAGELRETIDEMQDRM